MPTIKSKSIRQARPQALEVAWRVSVTIASASVLAVTTNVSQSTATRMCAVRRYIRHEMEALSGPLLAMSWRSAYTSAVAHAVAHANPLPYWARAHHQPAQVAPASAPSAAPRRQLLLVPEVAPTRPPLCVSLRRPLNMASQTPANQEPADWFLVTAYLIAFVVVLLDATYWRP